MESMQLLINSWGSLMKVTGRTLRIDTNWWYLVNYVWKHGTWIAYDTLTELDLVAITPNGIRVILKRLRCDTISEMLGI